MEDSNVMLDTVGETARLPARPPDREEEVIAMGAPQQDVNVSFAAYRQAIEIADAVRQRAIIAALASYRQALEDIEAAFRRDVEAAQCRYRQRVAGKYADYSVA
jgi:hypothetical protein